MAEVVKGVVCTYCGCTCDDIEVTKEGNNITKIKHGCAISMEKFLRSREERNLYPMLRDNGELRRVELDDAIEKAARILAGAKYPLLFGWSNTSCEAIKVGVELAEELGGALDNTTTVCHGPGLEAIQDIGEITCSLGEVKHRADLILYWGGNPMMAHVRHVNRYSMHSHGKFRKGRGDRKIVAVDVRKTVSTKLADLFIQVKPGSDYELFTALRMAVRGEELEAEEVGGVSREQIEELADMMISAQFGMVFFGLGLTHSRGKSENVAAGLSLVRDLNARTKFSIMALRGHHNVTGGNKVTAWQTGYPFAVDFSHGYPRYNPGETSAVDLLNREECDAALVVASDPVAHFPMMASKALSKIPVIVIDPSLNATSLLAQVVIPAAYLGVETEGSVYRMDGVCLKAKKVIDPPPTCLPDTEILERLLRRVRKIKEAA